MSSGFWFERSVLEPRLGSFWYVLIPQTSSLVAFLYPGVSVGGHHCIILLYNIEECRQRN